MTTFTRKKLEIPAVDVSGLSSLPLLYDAYPGPRPGMEPATEEEDGVFTDFGQVRGAFPYRAQDLYSRAFTKDGLDSIVLENEYLIATFIPELGGRLWSLYDKEAKKDLMFNNPVFQPAQLALRNAWCSGGCEWNLGWIGHHPRTCDRIFTAKLTAPDGTPILRFYDFERIRLLTYQMDFSLPSGSRYLYARMRVVNPTQKTQGVYWWSNIAVNHAENARVITHADHAYVCMDNKLYHKSIPFYDDKPDVTYPDNNPASIDHFFATEDGVIRYVTHVDNDGYGLVQASSQRMRGRKMFVWGTGEGSENFQQFLSGNGNNGQYCEIQAGLGQTQFENLPIPPKTAWEWVEIYGAMHADPKMAHGEWHQAQETAEANLAANGITMEYLEQWLKNTKKTALTPADEILLCGHGWGKLENMRREKNGESLMEPHLDWGECDEEQADWIDLLNRGEMQCPKDGNFVVPSWMVQKEWIQMLEGSTGYHNPNSQNWYAWLLQALGHLMMGDGNLELAQEELRKSIALRPNPWALYALGQSIQMSTYDEIANVYMINAANLFGEDKSLAIAVAKYLFIKEMYDKLADFCESRPAVIQALPRIRIYHAFAKAELGELEEGKKLLADESFSIPDMKEGETVTGDLYLRICEIEAERDGKEFDRSNVKIPKRINFYMYG